MTGLAAIASVFRGESIRRQHWDPGTYLLLDKKKKAFWLVTKKFRCNYSFGAEDLLADDWEPKKRVKRRNLPWVRRSEPEKRTTSTQAKSPGDLQ